MPYCHLWPLKLQPVLPSCENPRVVTSDERVLIFNSNGELKDLSDDHEGGALHDEQIAQVLKSQDTNLIKGVVELSNGAAFLYLDGKLLATLTSNKNPSEVSTMFLAEKTPILHIATKSVAHYNPNLISGAVAIVIRSDSRTVLFFDSWISLRQFLESPELNTPVHSAVFPSPIKKMTNQYSVLTEEGEVYVWGESCDQQPPTPSDEDEGFEEADWRHTLFNEPITMAVTFAIKPQLYLKKATTTSDHKIVDWDMQQRCSVSCWGPVRLRLQTQ